MPNRPLQKIMRGFTLVEMLTVMAIVLIIAAIVFAATQTSRLKARDAKRIADMHQVRIALESYFAAYKHYPAPAYYCDLLGDALFKNYLTVLPQDPQDTGGCGTNATYHYEYYADQGLQPHEWLLRVSGFELLGSGTQGALSGDIDNDAAMVPQTNTWIGGANTNTTYACTSAGCGALNCGAPGADTIYCLKS